jgi:hypothetical protein
MCAGSEDWRTVADILIMERGERQEEVGRNVGVFVGLFVKII